MQEQSAISSLSNMSFINSANNQRYHDFLGKNFDPNMLGETYRGSEAKQVDAHQLLLFSPMNNFSPKGTFWNLEKCWPLDEKHMERQQNAEQLPPLKLQPTENEEKPKKRRGKRAKKIDKGHQENIESGKIEENESDGQTSKSKNQTKNIPKNFGKAIITFIEKERKTIKGILDEYGICYETLLEQLTEKKKMINTIANLRELWVSDKNAECLRMISSQFLRKYSLNYIFNSRISNYNSHIKYRRRLLEAIENPNAFKHIKEY